MTLDVALVQIAGRAGERPEARRDRGLRLIEALDREAHLVVFPELWVGGYFNFPEYSALAETIPGPTTAVFSEVAKKRGIWLHAGSLVERGADGRLYNTSILFDSQGNLQAVYRKIHLFGHDSAEKNLLCPGSALTVVRMPQGCVGLATCYDLRFPELFRQLTDRGAEAFAVVAAWPERRVAHWIVLSRARALENLAYVIACNMSGVVAETRLGGHSLVADPWGAVVAEAGEEEQVLYARLDWDHLREIRRGFPALADRRL